MDLYKILGVEPSASQKEIKTAYKSLAQQLHPDKNPDEAERFEEISLAYAILKNEDDRANYDRTGSTERAPSIESKAEAVLAQMFNTLLADENAIYSDIIGTIRSNVNIQINNIQINITKMNKNTKFLEQIKERLACKNKEGMLIQAIDANIQNNKQALDMAEQELKMGAKAVELLGDYSFDKKTRDLDEFNTQGTGGFSFIITGA